jgi:hypothetical protein
VTPRRAESKVPAHHASPPCSRGLILKAGTGSRYVSGQFEIRKSTPQRAVARKWQGTLGAEGPEADLLTGAVHVGPEGSHASRLKRHSSGKVACRWGWNRRGRLRRSRLRLVTSRPSVSQQHCLPSWSPAGRRLKPLPISVCIAVSWRYRRRCQAIARHICHSPGSHPPSPALSYTPAPPRHRRPGVQIRAR